MPTPKNFHDIPDPHSTVAGNRQPNTSGSKLSLENQARKYKPPGVMGEPDVATLARVANHLIDRATGKAYSAEQLGSAAVNNANVASAIGDDPAAIRSAIKVGLTALTIEGAGVDPDGETDSTDAIEAIIALAQATGGPGAIFFPAGTYKCNISIAGNLHVIGAGAGNVGDWLGVGAAPRTKLIPASDASPIITITDLAGITFDKFEIRGNGAGTTGDGVLIDKPDIAFAGNGLICRDMTIRRCTRNVHSIGGCNIVFEYCGIFQGNYGLYIPELGFAHSYLFKLCSIGGAPATGNGRLIQVNDASFLTLLQCEMGNCTDMIGAGTVSNSPLCRPVINVIGGNMETMSASILNPIFGGTFNMRGTRIATGNKALVRCSNQYNDICGINILDNFAIGAMTLLEHYAYPFYRIKGNGQNQTVKAYDETFATVWGSSSADLVQAAARRTTDQVIASATTTTVICDTELFDLSSTHNATTGVFAAGKQCRIKVTAKVAVSDGTNMALAIYGGATTGVETLKGILGRSIAGGSGTIIGGSMAVSVAAFDKLTVCLISSAAVDILAVDGFTSTVLFEEIPYYE